MKLLLYFIFVAKFVSIKISGENFNFRSPLFIFIGPDSPEKFFIKASVLSKKKVKFILSKFILSIISVFKFVTDPFAIKSSNKFLSFK